jgi:hypothetical protein
MKIPKVILRLLGMRPKFSTWYHGTLSRANGESIQREGLKSSVYGTGRGRPYCTLASDKDDAATWAGRHGAIATIKVPHDQAAEYLTGDPMESWRTDRRFLSGINKPIPPDMISVEYVDDQRGVRRRLVIACRRYSAALLNRFT